jgi:hypothetical protein
MQSELRYSTWEEEEDVNCEDDQGRTLSDMCA